MSSVDKNSFSQQTKPNSKHSRSFQDRIERNVIKLLTRKGDGGCWVCKERKTAMPDNPIYKLKKLQHVTEIQNSKRKLSDVEFYTASKDFMGAYGKISLWGHFETWYDLIGFFSLEKRCTHLRDERRIRQSMRGMFFESIVYLNKLRLAFMAASLSGNTVIIQLLQCGTQSERKKRGRKRER